MNDTDNVKFALATQIFMKLRRHGRVIDVLWALHEPGYAQEVLRLARAIHDPELDQVADKLESLVAGVARPAPRPTALRSEPMPVETPPTEEEHIDSDRVSEHYVGHLR